MLTLGSLFDGIGGFPLAARRNEVKPVWASEIDKFCISITQKHFPEMEHVGDICQLNGAELKPVDIITFGSPCQNLSVAGNRQGLEGDESKLFMEAIRIINEMREATNNEYPKITLWENVPGAFSSNGGLDFQRVLSEFAKTKVPIPKSGQWADAGMVRGRQFSFAWRVLNAMYYGVPQRRRRIFLICDLRGQRAPEILFELQSLSRNNNKGREAGQGNTVRIKERPFKSYSFSAGQSSKAGSLGFAEELAPTLRGGSSGTNQVPTLIFDMAQMEDGVRTYYNNSPTLHSRMGTGGNSVPFVFAENQRGEVRISDKVTSISVGGGKPGQGYPAIAYGIKTTQTGSNGWGIQENTTHTLGASDKDVIAHNKNVRRLMPLECERLQGYPDGWTEGGSDAARYKALGNSIAVPCVQWLLKRIVDRVWYESVSSAN